MNTNDRPLCDRVQMAAMAHLDGERADLTPAEVDAHVAGCAECRAAVADFATLAPQLNRLDYESLDVDMWPAVRGAIASTAPQARPEGRLVLALAAVLVLWRLAQLSIDLPAPVLNSAVPLALVIVVLWRVTGDPFAIRATAPQLQREGV
jgi:anti-sigma factor RsiW